LHRIACGCFCLFLASSSWLFAADCASLKNLQLADTTLTRADSVTSGVLDIADAGATLRNLPAFCRVTGVIHPTSDSKIGFEVWLPAQDWNGRLLGVGNGGFAGSIYYQQMAGYLQRGFAVAGTDAGHQADTTDASWAFGHPEKIKDFGWRAVHLTAGHSKEILSAYYGKPADRAYFDSCSDGGREALVEAQRFPEDYDGILAGAPANAWSTMMAFGVGKLQDLTGDPRAYIPDGKLPAIQRASLAACDQLDGVKDGVIGDPAKCHFDPQVLLCKADDALDCLTQPQIETLKGIYDGTRDGKGAALLPGFSMGDETAWKEWIVGEDPTASLAARFIENYVRYMVTGDPRIDVLTANVDDVVRQSSAKNAADLDATNPDLSRFAARGGKLILYHGWNDPAIPPVNTVLYFESVEKQMGADKVDAFARLYMIPGMEHCIGGPGANIFGQYGTETSVAPKFGVFDSLENWVEKGSPLSNVVATKYETGPDGSPKPAFTRPLCAWPTVAHYKGAGDSNDAASFACVAP
jgi:Tannase and feruloyl esterase